MALREIRGCALSSSSGFTESNSSRKRPFMGHTSKCAREKFSEQLKHSPFSRFAAISAHVRRRKRGVVWPPTLCPK
jgi:hypothetical protein